ncbi:MAG: SAM-dependent methyltransferase [Rickettsiales bacterium]|jgi:SAM-dependent methyltransferase
MARTLERRGVKFSPTMLERVVGAKPSTVQPPNNVVRIFDFGCGDGRFFDAVKNIADELSKIGMRVEMVAYDPSQAGLDVYSRKLVKKYDFSQTESPNETSSRFSKDNLTVHFLKGEFSWTPEEVRESANALVPGGSFDLTMCMFGTLSHIPKRENRVAFLKMFGDSVNKDGEVVLSLPNKLKRFVTEQREQRKNPPSEDMEEGDIFYGRKDKDGKEVVSGIFYHLYSRQEIIEDIKSAEMKGKGWTANVLGETVASKNPLLRNIDRALSYISTKSGIISADYFGVSARKDPSSNVLPTGTSPLAPQERGLASS